GVGAIGDGERFGDNYELPNATAYNETCAAIAQVFWNQRMFLLHGDSKYIDVLEKTLYNGFISGVGLDGKSFFYTNAMQIKNSFNHPDMEATRSGWFPCSCCPTNVVRLMPSIPGYVYAQQNDKLYANLFIAGTTTLKINGKEVNIIQQNNYPWDGDLKFTVTPKSAFNFSMLIRIPGWARNEAMPSDLYTFNSNSDKKTIITVNGKEVEYTIENGYAVLNKKWKKNDVIEVKLPLEVRKVVANANVKSDIGKVALQRGPIMYCAEWVDNNGKAANLVMPVNTTFQASYNPGLLNGIEVLKANVPAVIIENNGETIQTKNQNFMAIPYYSWANRGKGEMMLWFPEKIKDIDIVASE
ncbi:MAG TPA: beta-L-arabinofuranosidase domain-containing protein, partial [Ginsengibacter sp.]|nr:beta-L-arabinofuranosidase domain-containing protein [Ginsengibacter sp.]